jgi:hypothetical protein
MATIFPNAPAGVLPPGVLRAFQFLKSLSDETMVWHHLAPWEENAPDFLILNARRQALLLKVSPASQARSAAQLLLMEGLAPALGAAEESVLAGFLERAHRVGISPGQYLTSAVLFPNLSARQIAESRPSDHLDTPAWLGKEALQPACLDLWEVLFTTQPLDDSRLEQLRALFVPEVVIPPALTVSASSRRELEAGLTHHLLDYDQEAALKADLNLPEQETGLGDALAGDFRLNLVNGVAGSGKTLILLYRLRLLYGLYPHKHFLVLTHNRPLNHDLQARFVYLNAALGGATSPDASLPEAITWETFNGWCRAHWPDDPPWVAPLGQARRERLLRAAWLEVARDQPGAGALGEDMLRSEISWIKDQPAFELQEYLDVERRGRGFRLPRPQRQLVLAVLQRYEERLRRTHSLDWHDVPRRMLEFLESGRVAAPAYDVILVDEAQFFAPLWFEILRRLLKPRSGHLFLAADPTQGFLRRGASWKSLGLEVRGHSFRLKRSYRTTREILDFATLFYRGRLPVDGDEEEILAPDLLNMPNGALPYLIQLKSPQDEVARAANEIAALVEQGVPRRDILALHAGWQGAQQLVRALERRLGRGAAGDPKQLYPGNYVRVTTLNAGTGLESPIVFLLGLHALFEQENSLRLSDAEREQLVLENTRKVYMAITRAGQRLVFTYVGELPPALQGLAAQGAS